jgi:hypothetical protein
LRASFPGSGNISICAGRLERLGVLIDPTKKRRTLAGHSPHNIGRFCGGSDFSLIFQIFVRSRVSIEDGAIKEAQSASLGAWFQASR